MPHSHLSPPIESTPALPPGYRSLRDRTRPGAVERVIEAVHGDRKVALRLSPDRAGTELRAELSVLSSVAHPGLAALLDFGALPDQRGSFIAREWIDGTDLATWSHGRAPEEIGRVVAHLCAGLEALHARGFVHGDLKAGNVFVVDEPAGPRAILTDFGLSRARGERGETSGTLFHIAPELLFGGAIDAAADLFALGVMLHELLLGRRPSAREFYGRFPAYDFFEATRTSIDELPLWARDVVAGLVEREKHRRPASAADVGRTLAGRLGLEGLFRERRVELHWPPALGRDAWIARAIGELTNSSAPHARWLLFQRDEHPRGLIDELALRATLRGVRAQRIDIAAQIESLLDARALEPWALEICARHAGTTLFLALDASNAWAVRAVETLAQVLGGLAPQARPEGLIVGAHTAVPQSEVEWNVLEVPELDSSAIAEFAREKLPNDGARAEAFARLLASAARGSATRIERALQRAVRDGWIVAGDNALRLRSGPLPASLAEADAASTMDRNSVAARALAAIHAHDGTATIAEVCEVGGVDETAIGAAVAELVERDLIEVEHNTSLRALVTAPEPADVLVDESIWREIHRRRADRLVAAAALRARVLAHQLRCGRASAGDVAIECEGLRDRGSAEIALRLCDAAISQRRAAGLAVEPELVGERALAWCAMGDADRALESLAATDESRLDPRSKAIFERVRGQVAMSKHELAQALEHLEHARFLDPSDGGLAVLAKVRLLAEMGRDREVLASIEELRRDAAASASILPRTWINLRILEAMSVFRSGDAARAKEMLEADLHAATLANDGACEAGLRLNLATVERRGGDLQSALSHFERAVELYESAGLLPGLAQARAQFGSTLRDVGELARAQPLLLSALSIRERLGDRVGATTVRGMLGLLFADRGHVRAATEELERAARDLRAEGRSRVAVMLEARAVEVRARYGDRAKLIARVASEVDRAAEGDPRILLSRARALWLAGETPQALECVQRTDALAKSLGLAAWRVEAQFLLARMRGEAPRRVAEPESLVEEDEALLHLLSQAPLDVAQARAMARRLAARGRDDRAARLLLAVAARVDDEASADDALKAEALIADCARGSSAAEAAALRRTLLALPDPWPEDFIAHERRRALPEENEMEVVGLLEINHRLLAQEDLRSLLGLIVEQALTTSGAQRGFLILEEDGELKVDTALDSRRGGIDTPDVEVSGSVLREALHQMKPVRVSNAVDDPQLGAAPSVIHLELRSILCVPFQVQKGLRGVIYVDHRLREGAFDARVERMLALLAGQAALAILQVRRLEEIRRLNRELGKQVARKESDLKTATEALRKLNVPAPAAGLVGDSPVMREVRRLIERAAQSKLTVLVTGPSGSGKELAARALHELGPRRDQPFVGENCAALPASLIEAELFGARRGAYTGADRDRDGLFERANGGTLFLDEIGELPLDLQAKLLRVLETSQVRRLGDDRVRTVDFRLVAATNRDLAREVAEGRFRADLYYRLDGLRITMPALAAHPEDIPALVDHHQRLSAEPGKPLRKIAPAVVARLCRRAWPGNVRELYNELARLSVMSEGDIDDAALVREPETTSTPAPSASSGAVKTLEDLEREAILHALQVAGNDKRKAAELLGISRAKVYQRLKDWGLTGSDGSGDA